MARVYIASKYERHKLNRCLEKHLRSEGFDVFLPEHYEVRAIKRSEKIAVRDECIRQLYDCDVLFAVGPCGNDINFEVSAAFIASMLHHPMLIVRWNTTDDTSIADDIVHPTYDYESDSLKKVVNYLKSNKPHGYEPLGEDLRKTSRSLPSSIM